MTRLVWNSVGERVFETGVDRGVLYVDGSDAVPWNGLVSVSESPTGGDITPYYIDGIKYLDHAIGEEFEATIEAFTYPDEFAECEGQKPIIRGLFVGQQKKKSFSLAYRTKIGNDVDSTDHGYKIHLIYNATVAPAEKEYVTVGEELEPSTFSWELVTKPPTFTGYKPASHFVIDSREVPEPLLTLVEDILYGSDTLVSRIPSVPELIYLFESYSVNVDAGFVGDEYYLTYDAGTPSEISTLTIDGGGP